MLKKFWPPVLIGVIVLTAAVIRIQDFLEKPQIGNTSNQNGLFPEKATSSTPQNNMEQKPTSTMQNSIFPSISFGELRVPVMVADTPGERFQGLSGQKDMGQYGGMLFVFEESSYYTMVMRGMLFPLDFIWLEGDAVADVRENALPENGIPENELTRYTNRNPANMVLEVPAGFVAKNKIKAGDMVDISI